MDYTIACIPSMDYEGRAGFPASDRGSQSLAAILIGSSPHIAREWLIADAAGRTT